jgi:anti-sigma factor RsiW
MSLSCRKQRARIHRHLDGSEHPSGALSEKERLDLERHLESCPACASLASDLQESLRLLRALEEEGPSESFDWRLRLRLSRAGTEAAGDPFALPGRRWRWGLKFGLSTAVVATLVVAAGLRLARLPDGTAPGFVNPSAQESGLADQVNESGSVRFPDAEGRPGVLPVESSGSVVSEEQPATLEARGLAGPPAPRDSAGAEDAPRR